VDAADIARRFALGSAAGVPTPRVRRTTEGSVFAAVGGGQVRVYEWVDLRTPDTGLDPELVGAVVATIHRVSVDDPGPLDPERADSAAWIGEIFDEPHTRELLETLLGAVRGGSPR
jgi:hypothetical protein